MGSTLTNQPGDGDARLVLVHAGQVVDLGPVARGDRCGLGFVDDLLRLRLALARFGWALVVADVPADVLELFELVGLAPDPGQASR